MSQQRSCAAAVGVSLALTVLVFTLPGLVISPPVTATPTPPRQSVAPTISTAAPTIEPESQSNFQTNLQTDLDDALPLQLLQPDGEITTLPLGEYLVGVVSAEMPASFDLEALKAQACAARTYTLYQMQHQSNHEGADVCTDPGCCQAYLAPGDAIAKWGTLAEQYESRIRAAVEATSGQTIDYDGAPILAVFHAASVGQTRQAGDVWVSDLPYLQSVSSPETADTVPNYITYVTFSPGDLQEHLQTAVPSGDFSGTMDTWLTNPVLEPGGTVDTVCAGGVSVAGTALRTALGLRSACFTWAEVDGEMVFTVTGYGHGVGLSQYGANTMATSGAAYQDILTHYYTGTTLDTQCVAAMASALH